MSVTPVFGLIETVCLVGCAQHGMIQRHAPRDGNKFAQFVVHLDDKKALRNQSE